MEAIKGRRADNDNMCRFLRDNVIPRFASEVDMERDICGNIECYTCANCFAFWLDEEYTEPPKPEVDWYHVPVDTLVRVKNDKEEEAWTLRYFCEFDGDTDRKYGTFPNGRTSKTATYYIESWRFCELVEDEDDGCN